MCRTPWPATAARAPPPPRAPSLSFPPPPPPSSCPRLPAEPPHLPQPRLALPPTLQERRHFRIAAPQRRQACGSGHVQAAPCPAGPQDEIHWHRGGYPFEGLGTQSCDGKIPLHESVR